MIGLTDLLHPSPTPHFKTFQALQTWLEINPNHAAITVFKAVWLRTQFLWDVTHHCWITGPQCFEGTQCLYFQGSRGPKKKSPAGYQAAFLRENEPILSCLTKTVTVTYLFTYHRRDINFILTASLTKICEALYLCFQICHVVLPSETPVQLYLFYCYCVLTMIRISYVNKELVSE
jgi:hypothetical protein